jgi:murein DD-endopeptidase MepM/ murein hydrolase activator NlpD
VLKQITIIILLGCLLGCSKTSLLTEQTDSHPEISVDIRFPLEEYVIFNNFGVYSNEMGNEYHAAEDAIASGGTPVYAIADGIISFSGPMLGYGYLIVIDHSDRDIYSLYGHLSTSREKMSDGAVKMGERIAYIGYDEEDGSGGIYPYWAPHLHFGIRKGQRKDYDEQSDRRWMAGWTRAYPTNYRWIKPSDYIIEQLTTD